MIIDIYADIPSEDPEDPVPDVATYCLTINHEDNEDNENPLDLAADLEQAAAFIRHHVSLGRKVYL